MYEHQDLEKILMEAGIPIPMTIAERVTLMLQTINDVKMKKLALKSVCGLIDLMESLGRDVSGELEQNRENNTNELRGLKNSFRMQEYALHEAMRDTDEV
jgi:hypothetical protein